MRLAWSSVANLAIAPAQDVVGVLVADCVRNLARLHLEYLLIWIGRFARVLLYHSVDTATVLRRRWIFGIALRQIGERIFGNRFAVGARFRHQRVGFRFDGGIEIRARNF